MRETVPRTIGRDPAHALRARINSRLSEDRPAPTPQAFSGCFEIGRLVCERQTGDPLLAARLLAAAGEWAAERPGCGGLIAVCSRLRTRVFRRYGMHPVNDNSLFLKDRPSAPYLLLHGDFQTLRVAMRETLSAADPHALATRPLAA